MKGYQNDLFTDRSVLSVITVIRVYLMFITHEAGVMYLLVGADENWLGVGQEWVFEIVVAAETYRLHFWPFSSFVFLLTVSLKYKMVTGLRRLFS